MLDGGMEKYRLTVRISSEAHAWLLRYAGRLQVEEGKRRVTVSEVVERLVEMAAEKTKEKKGA